jgi:hypothetical protein
MQGNQPHERGAAVGWINGFGLPAVDDFCGGVSARLDTANRVSSGKIDSFGIRIDADVKQRR